MGLESVIAVMVVAVGAFASWMQGKKSGTTDALSQAGDVVGMLSTQVGELRIQLSEKEAQLDAYRNMAGPCSACQRQGTTPPAKRAASPPGTDNG